MEEQLAANIELQARLRAQLDQLRASHAQASPQIRSSIEAIHHKLHNVQEVEGRRLLELTLGTAAEGGRMSEAIRRLDREQHRVLEAMQLLGRVERLRELFTGLAVGEPTSIQSACERVRELGEFSEACWAAFEARYPEHGGARGQLEATRQHLLDAVLREMDAVLAAESLQPAALQNAFSLLVRIGRGKEGVVRYASFLNAQAERSVELLLGGLDRQKDLPYAGQLARLFEYASGTLHWTFRTAIAGPGVDSPEHRQIVALSFLQIVGEAAERLADLFLEQRLQADRMSLYQADLAVAELLLICRHLLSFAGDIGPETGAELLRLHAALLARYPAAELEYVRRGVLKAAELDQLLPEDRLGSRVDDTLFLAKKAALRALGAGHEPTFRRVVLGTLDILRGPFADGLQAATRTGVHATEGIDKKRAYATACNNLCAATGFIGRLLDELAAACPEGSSLELLDELTERFGQLQEHLANYADSSMHALYRGLVRSKFMAGLATALKDCQYETESDTEAVVQKYASAHAAALAEVDQWLTEDAALRLGHILAAELVAYWTKAILKSRFTQIGAFQLDRQLRAVIAFYIDRYDLRLKASFHLLSETAALLMADSRDEAQALATEYPHLDTRLLALRTDW